MPQEVIALAVLEHAGPALEVGQLFLGLLGEQVVGDAYAELALLGQLLDHRIVVRVVLVAATGIDGAGDAQAVQLAHELAGRVDLVFQRQFRPLGQGRIEDQRVGAGDQHAGRFALGVTLDLPAGRVRRVAGVADHFERGAVEQRAIIEMEDENRRIRRRLVQFVEGRHALLGELEFVPAADHPHPLRSGCALGLILEHAQGVGQRRHALPTQLEVVVEAATDQVQVRVVEPGDHRAPLQVDHFCGAATQGHGLGIAAYGDESALLDRHGGGRGFFAVDRMQTAVMQNQIGVHVIPRSACVSRTGDAGERQCGPECAGGTEHRAGG